MTQTKYKNPGAQFLANTRWAKATPAQRAAQAAKMVAGRKRARLRAAKEKA